MRKIGKLITTVTLLTGLILGSVGCGQTGTTTQAQGQSTPTSGSSNNSGAASESFTIRVGVNSGDGNMLLKILDNHTGFVKDRGINLEISEFAAGINTIDAITTGQLDVGLFADYAGVNRIGNTLADTELRAFAMINKSNSHKLYVDPEKITSPEDLVGQTIASMAGVVYEYDYGRLFEAYGIDPSSVTVANVSSVQEALALAQSKSAVSFWVNPNAGPMFEEVGWVPLLSVGDVDATMFTFLVANNSYLTEHKEEVSKFLQVSDEAFKYIEDHKEEFFTWVEADTGLKKDLGIANWDSANHEYSFYQEAYEDLIKVEKWCYNNGNFQTDYDFGDFINTDALKEAFPDRVEWTRK